MSKKNDKKELKIGDNVIFKGEDEGKPLKDEYGCPTFARRSHYESGCEGVVVGEKTLPSGNKEYSVIITACKCEYPYGIQTKETLRGRIVDGGEILCNIESFKF